MNGEQRKNSSFDACKLCRKVRSKSGGPKKRESVLRSAGLPVHQFLPFWRTPVVTVRIAAMGPCA